jgi:rod shape-determining protein MreC
LDLVDVRRENIVLRSSVKLLNERIVAGNEALVANARMKALLDLKVTLPLPSLAVSVIGEDSSAWFKTLVVDRGSADGLLEGMPVVVAGGVVGRLVKVAPQSSRVLLLTDHASAIAALVQRSRARGVVRGAGEGRCSLEFTVRDEDVKVGDTVISSGIGGVFPKGLAIGEVTMVKKGEYGVFQTIEVRPTVNLGKLEEMLVLRRQVQ